MTQTSTLSMQEIDDGWRLDEAPPPPDDEPYEEYILETAPPSSGFEEAYWEQVEGRTLTRRFGERAGFAFGTHRAN